jgi:hypothetical protein
LFRASVAVAIEASPWRLYSCRTARLALSEVARFDPRSLLIGESAGQTRTSSRLKKLEIGTTGLGVVTPFAGAAEAISRAERAIRASDAGRRVANS